MSSGKEAEWMVKRLKLNEKALREAEPKPGISYQIFDTEVIASPPGFRLRAPEPSPSTTGMPGGKGG